MRKPYSLTWISLVAGVAVLQYLAVRLGLVMGIAHGNVSPVWPATGFAIAVLLRLGVNLWPGVALGSLLGLAQTGVGALVVVGEAAAALLEALTAVGLVRRCAAADDPFSNTREVIFFCILAGGAATAVSATVGVTSLCLGDVVPWNSFMYLWGTWWLGDVMGALIVAPFLFVWSGSDAWKLDRSTWIKTGFMLMLLVIAGFVAFWGPFVSTTGVTDYPIAFLTLPMVVVATFLAGRRGATAACLICSAMAISGTAHGLGPFFRGSVNESLLLLQSYLVVVSVTSIILAAVLNERNQALDGLVRSRDELEKRVGERTRELLIANEQLNREMTERKQAQEQLLQSQKMEAIGTLAGGVAHEINNLLQVVLGHTDLILMNDRIEAKLAESVEAIRRAAHNGADLVNRILAFSRKAQPEMRPVNLSDEVRRVDGLLRRTIPRMIKLEMHLEDNLRTISADPSQIEQVLLNLAVNAKDAMPEGGTLVFETHNVTIHEEYCRTFPEVKPGEYVLLAVSDNGHGMEKEISDRIFEPFFTTKEQGKGTGLGLSMVFGIVKSHGGHITCQSKTGAGSTFKLYFPVLIQEPVLEPATTVQMAAGGTETLLLVEDEDAVRTLGAEMLKTAGYTVLTAANGREALEIYRDKSDSIALVILDLIMPVMSGGMCLEELLKINPNVKVLIASGYSADGPAEEARESKATGFLSKPFDLREILLAIRKSLDSV